MKFTFKKYIKTGRYRAFELDLTDIKLKRKVVGQIRELRNPTDPNERYNVSLALKREPTEDSPAPFKWIFLKKRFHFENDARKFVNEHINSILEKYDLYYFEDF